jgi:hypothetical protein
MFEGFEPALWAHTWRAGLMQKSICQQTMDSGRDVSRMIIHRKETRSGVILQPVSLYLWGSDIVAAYAPGVIGKVY